STSALTAAATKDANDHDVPCPASTSALTAAATKDANDNAVTPSRHVDQLVKRDHNHTSHQNTATAPIILAHHTTGKGKAKGKTISHHLHAPLELDSPNISLPSANPSLAANLEKETLAKNQRPESQPSTLPKRSTSLPQKSQSILSSLDTGPVDTCAPVLKSIENKEEEVRHTFSSEYRASWTKSFSAQNTQDEADVFPVEAILSHSDRWEDGRLRYEVKWEGYEKKKDRTWETEENLRDALDLVQQYWDTIGGRGKNNKRGRESTGTMGQQKKRGRPSL
ncbi:MAG: hypothetical protein Q9174_006651, partial [Haloplaca sp. 1 TL-2023]